jgi:nitric oxide reductase activation protein
VGDAADAAPDLDLATGDEDPDRAPSFGRRAGAPERRARRRTRSSRRTAIDAAGLTGARIRARSVREAPDVRIVRHEGGPHLEDAVERRGRIVGIYPEWDDLGRRYREDWCHVREVPLDRSDASTEHPTPYAPIVRRQITHLHLEHTRLSHQLDGEELDLDAVIDQEVRRRSGDEPDELVYASRRRRGRDLGVLVLIDGSASTGKQHGTATTVAERQRDAAAVLIDAFESAGDRVACHAFRSHGRRSVEFSAIKHFDERHAANVRRDLGRIRPEGFTRLGAAIRHATELLVAGAGTRRWLLLVLTDAFPFDLEYEGVTAAADSRRALVEARSNGVGCLCLSVGAAAGDAELRAVFGSSTFASASSISELDADLASLAATALALADRRRQLSAATARTSDPAGSCIK